MPEYTVGQQAYLREGYLCGNRVCLLAGGLVTIKRICADGTYDFDGPECGHSGDSGSYCWCEAKDFQHTEEEAHA